MSILSKNLKLTALGVWERIGIGFYLLWVVVPAVMLLRKEINDLKI